MDTFQFFKSKRKFKFDINCCIGIMCKLYMIMKPEFLCRNTQAFMPFHSFCFPIVVPFHFCSGLHKELHFHLFKFTHSENKLACYNFIAECFASLCNS